MKKILIATNILLFGITMLLLFYWRSPFIKGDNTSVKDDKTSSGCMASRCMEPRGPAKGRISVSTARQISQDYKRDESKGFIWSSTGRTSQEDACSIWFGLETIKRYIWEIESAACGANCTDTLGIRIYYARYPKDLESFPEFAGLDPSYANRHTLFMVPTYWDGAAERYIDFNPAAGCRASFDRPLLKKTAPSMIYMPSSEDPSAQNHGGLAPPPDGVTSGTFPTSSF